MKEDRKKDLKLIKEALNCYIEGAIKRDYKLIYESWHPDAQMMTKDSMENNLKSVPRSFWKEAFENRSGDPQIKRASEIEYINFTGTAASAKINTVEDSLENNNYFTDYINLLKLGKQWFIVNKIFYFKSNPK